MSCMERNLRTMHDFIFYSIGVERPITPDEPLPPLPHIPRGALVVVEGRRRSGATEWRSTACTALRLEPSRFSTRDWERSSLLPITRTGARAKW